MIVRTKKTGIMSKRSEGISIIFPAYNEEANIEDTIKRTIAVMTEVTDDWEIIVVDDGSTDGTAEIIDRYRTLGERFTALHHPINRGYGAALKSGIINAKKDLIFFCDSDLQFDIREIDKLLGWIDAYDIVIGYRAKRQDPYYRRLNAFGWNILVRFVLGLKIRDIDCAFKIFRRKVFDRISIEAVGAMVNTDILAKALKLGFTLKEVPVTHYPRLKGKQTGAKLRVIIKAFGELITLSRKLKLDQ